MNSYSKDTTSTANGQYRPPLFDHSDEQLNDLPDPEQEPESEINSTGESTAQLINHLLKDINKVDFKKLAGLDSNDEEKLKSSDYHVLVSKQVLERAKTNKWDLCRRYDFFYMFNGSHWQQLDRDDLRRFLGQAAEKMGVPWLKAQSVDFRKKLTEQFEETAYMPPPAYDENRVLVSLQNGTFAIETSPNRQYLRSPEAKDFLTHQLPFRYDPDATAPQFQTFLDRVLPDLDCQKILAEFLGYIFIRTTNKRYKLEKVLLLYGSGANGKSVVFEVIMGLLGAENVSNFSFESLTNKPEYRAGIVNKLLNYASEISGNLESTSFKSLASGEPLEARLLYGNAFTMTTYARLIANTNELPNVTEHSHAFFRRFLILPFMVTIPDHEQDRGLSKKIVDQELPGVFNWLLAGLRRLLEQGHFTHSEAVENQINEYKRLSDSVQTFFEENHYAKSDAASIPLQELYPQYTAFCRENGYKPVNSRNFKRRLENKGYCTQKRNIGQVVFVERVWIQE